MTLSPLARWKQSRATLAEARRYFSMIGKPQMTTSKSVGRLHAVCISTEINYQATDGAKNYHACKDFDLALAAVVRRRFAELANEALDDLEKQVAADGAAAREDVATMLKEIDATNTGDDQ